MPTTAYYSNDEDLASGRKYLGGDVNYIKWTPGTRIKKGQLGLGGNAVIPNSAYYGGQALGGYDAEGTANEIQKYQGLNNATATANLQYAPQINPISSKIQGIQASMADAARQAEAQRLAANNLSLDNVNQIRRLQDSNRGRTNETMNTRGLMNSGINDYAQGQINAAEGAGLRNNQAQLSQTLKGIQDWLSGVQQTGQGNVADLESQKAGLLAQVPQLAQSIYDKQQSDAAAAKFEQDQAIAKLMGIYQGAPTLAGQEFTRAGQQADRTFGLQEGELLGNYQGLPTLGRERMNQDVNQFYQKQAQDESQFGRSNAIAQQRANVNEFEATGNMPNGKTSANVPTPFMEAAINAGNATGVDPLLIAAIGKHETGYGTLGAGREGYSLGYGYPAPGQGNAKYQDAPGEFSNQTLSAAKQIAGYLGNKDVTLENLTDFMNNSWKPGDRNWANAVWREYQQLNKDATTVGSAPTKKLTGPERTDAATADAMDILNQLANQHKTRTEIMKFINDNSGRFEASGASSAYLRDWADKAFEWDG